MQKYLLASLKVKMFVGTSSMGPWFCQAFSAAWAVSLA